MPKFTGVSLQTLNERLGGALGSGTNHGPGLHRHTFRMVWDCTCFATAAASDKPMPPDLTPWEEELFDNAPLPKDGWTIAPCPHHLNVFADHSGQSD